MRWPFRGHHSNRRSSAARRLATAAEETTPSAVGCSTTHEPPLRALPRRPSPQVASPDPISRSGEYRPPPGRPCSLVRRGRQPSTSAAIPRPAATRPPPASWGNTRWASRVWRRVVLALRPPPRLRYGCSPRRLGSAASATIGCARLSNAEQLGEPDMACRGRWIFAAGTRSTERIFGVRSASLAATRGCRRARDVSARRDGPTTERGGRLESLMLGGGARNASDMWSADGRAQNFRCVNLPQLPSRLAHWVTRHA